jgi:DNA-binding NarL/FixJ family response regulator
VTTPEHSASRVGVFIADDSPLIRDRLTAMLGELRGVEVVGQAGTLRGAVQRVRLLQPTVVILDIRVAGSSSLDALVAIKQLSPSPIVIVLTNYAYPAYRTRYLEAGADFFFDKSTEMDKVLAVFDQLN